MPKRTICQVCERKVGSTKNLDGEEDGVPLGELEKCDCCGKWACPDCLHEADCCFADDSTDKAPPGWRMVTSTGPLVYVRVKKQQRKMFA